MYAHQMIEQYYTSGPFRKAVTHGMDSGDVHLPLQFN